MKRNLFTLALMAITILVTAQTTKKIAILETVDREDKIPYAIKLVLRSNLAKAITNTTGYEAYDRTDMDAIVGEQNFQRTGMVSNEQIKKLGEMTGAQYVLVAEAVMFDNKTLYIIAKLLDVETGRIEATDNEMMGNNAQEIQRGCQSLAKKLIVAQSAGGTNKQQAQLETQQNQNDKNVTARTIIDDIEIKEGYIISSGYLMERITSNEYRLGDTKMDRRQCEDFFYRNCPSAWKKYRRGQQSIAAGWSFFGIGLAFTSLYSLMVIDDELGLSFGTAGVLTTTLLSVPLLIGGYATRNNAYKLYNKRCANSQLSLGLQTGPEGVGLAINF